MLPCLRDRQKPVEAAPLTKSFTHTHAIYTLIHSYLHAHVYTYHNSYTLSYSCIHTNSYTPSYITHTDIFTYTHNCALSHTHIQTFTYVQPWRLLEIAGDLGRGFVAARPRQEKVCTSPYHSHRWWDLGVSPKERKQCFLVYVEMGKTSLKQWHFRKTPLCSGDTRRGFPSGLSRVPLPWPANHNSHMAFSGTSLSSEVLIHSPALNPEKPGCLLLK